jgi:hypothetical protein
MILGGLLVPRESELMRIASNDARTAIPLSEWRAADHVAYAHVKDQVCCEERGHINVKGISHIVATYQVIDLYDNLGKSRNLIHEDYGTLKLDIDLEAMSTTERRHAVTVLQQAVDRLSRATEAATPTIP